MSFQYTYNTKGEPIGVFMPRSIPSKDKVLAGIEKGLKQVKQIEAGKRKSISLKDLLDAL